MPAAAMKTELRDQLKRQLKADRQIVIAGFHADGMPEKLLRSLRQSVDAVLTTAWQAAGLPANTALVAVGGYGRGELFPYSDVDVLLLLEQAPDPSATAKLEELVQLLWDLGLEIGHSIRTVDECLSEAAADITVQTSLLEARLIYGSAPLFATLQQRYDAAMDPQAFFHAKMLEMKQRHAKYEDTAFSLEPNCKESPGGLRDLQVILWMVKAAGLASSWRTLATSGLITQTEAKQLMEKERAFKDIRVRLHLHAGRREDRLVFDVQTAIAESLGLQTTGSGVHLRRASEYLMQRYYWAAKTVVQLNMILLQNIEERLFPQSGVATPINPRFNEVDGLIDIGEDDTFATTPSAMLEIFVLMTERPAIKGMTARTIRALWHERFKIDGEFRQNPVNRAYFLRILQAPQGIIHALRRMNDLSVLGRYLPNFRKIVGQMQHDLFHVYTVDQHIMMVVRNMRRFTMTEHAHEYPFCSQLMANFPNHWLLYVAALFHDIAKGRGGDHSELGMADARQFCQDHAMSEEDTELVVFLVGHHLTMSQVAQKQDLSDPEVIESFAKTVRDERHLTALYLLTVADIRRHQPQGVECLEGQAAGRPVQDHPARTGRRAALGRPRAEKPPARGAGHPAPVRPAAGRPRGAVEAARRRLFPAPRRLRHRPGRRAPCGTASTATSRWSSAAWRRSAKACRSPSTCRTRPTCSPASAAISTARISASWMPRFTPPGTAMRSTPSW